MSTSLPIIVGSSILFLAMILGVCYLAWKSNKDNK